MRTSENIDQLATALAAAQAEMKNAKLNKVNPHFKSKYADLAEIRDTVTPALSKNGIAVVQGTDAVETGILVVTRLVHKSGQWIESRFPIAYDKPQTMGSAYTYAKRYSLAAICNIAADEDDDANAANDKPVAALKVTASEYKEMVTREMKAAQEEARPSEFPSVTGTPGASKAAFRAPFDEMTKRIRNSPSRRELKALWTENAAEIDEFPPDWVDMLKNEYIARKAELEKALAA